MARRSRTEPSTDATEVTTPMHSSAAMGASWRASRSRLIAASRGSSVTVICGPPLVSRSTPFALARSCSSILPIHRRAELGLSYLPQEASVFRKLTVEENIRAVLELQRYEGKPLSKEQIANRLNALLSELQIEKLRENQAMSLSGGERRRVENRARAGHQPALHPSG